MCMRSMCVRTHAHVYVRVRACACVNKRVRACACMCARACACVCVYSWPWDYRCLEVHVFNCNRGSKNSIITHSNDPIIPLDLYPITQAHYNCIIPPCALPLNLSTGCLNCIVSYADYVLNFRQFIEFLCKYIYTFSMHRELAFVKDLNL